MSVHLVADALLASRRTIALTGAGVSVESGIPDFRSAGGLWDRFPPEEFGTIEAFRADPARSWRLFRELGRLCEGARPNPAHAALAWLERVGLLHAVITQNVDVLHQRAGSREVIELHGTAGRLVCPGCGARRPGDGLDGDALDGAGPADDGVPRCDACGGPLKPDVVLFGEHLPEAALRRAQALAEACDVCLVVGTSAVVYPAATIPHLAHERGATVVQFDLEPTELSLMGRVRHFVRGKAGETLPRVVEAIRARSKALAVEAEASPDR